MTAADLGEVKATALADLKLTISPVFSSHRPPQADLQPPAPRNPHQSQAVEHLQARGLDGREKALFLRQSPVCSEGEDGG